MTRAADHLQGAPTTEARHLQSNQAKGHEFPLDWLRNVAVAAYFGGMAAATRPLHEAMAGESGHERRVSFSTEKTRRSSKLTEKAVASRLKTSGLLSVSPLLQPRQRQPPIFRKASWLSYHLFRWFLLRLSPILTSHPNDTNPREWPNCVSEEYNAPAQLIDVVITTSTQEPKAPGTSNHGAQSQRCRAEWQMTQTTSAARRCVTIAMDFHGR